MNRELAPYFFFTIGAGLNENLHLILYGLNKDDYIYL